MTVQSISPKGLQQLIREGGNVEIIDVRSAAEYQLAHVKLARLVPFETLDTKKIMLSRTCAQDVPICFICHNGKWGKLACERFQAAGYSNVLFIEGGIIAWMEARLPVLKGEVAMSPERKARITAGVLSLFGTLVGAFVNPAFLAIPALVGLSLVLAGMRGSELWPFFSWRSFVLTTRRRARFRRKKRSRRHRRMRSMHRNVD
jgi:rhodanese-related sulfurtransferase